VQNRIEESTNFKSDIRNDPFLLMETIKMKMYGQVRAKYEFVQHTDIILQFLSLKEDHGESLIEYSKRFKQSLDNLKAIFGKEFLSGYIEKTDDYKKSTTTTDEKTELKEQAFLRWMSYVYLKNSDPKKYGSLNRNLQSQYALQNDQYPKTISKVTDVLTNHQCDDSYQEIDKKLRESRRNNNRNTNESENKSSLAQTSVCANEINVEEIKCFCCVERGH
jgi:hypothetical protein